MVQRYSLFFSSIYKSKFLFCMHNTFFSVLMICLVCHFIFRPNACEYLCVNKCVNKFGIAYESFSLSFLFTGLFVQCIVCFKKKWPRVVCVNTWKLTVWIQMLWHFIGGLFWVPVWIPLKHNSFFLPCL